MAHYRFFPSPKMLLLPLLVIMTFMCSVGIGFWFSAINAMYRDVRYIIPFLIQMGIFVTPVIYPTSMIPERYTWILYLNPMAGIIEGFRAAVLPDKAIPLMALSLSAVIIAVSFITGLYFFRRMERIFSDAI